MSGPDGATPPEGMFTVTPALVSLPENGSVSVTVTANTALDAADGIYGGRLLALDDTGRTLATPLVLAREEESYELTLRHLDREGNATAGWFTDVVAYGTGIVAFPAPVSDVPADVTLRLPKDRYAIVSSIGDTRIMAPNQLLDADRLLVLDSSAAAPVIVSPPRPGLELSRVSSSWGLDLTNGAQASGGFSYDPATLPLLFYQAEIDPPAPSLLANLNATWLDTTSTPQESHVAFWTAEGRLIPPGTHSVPSLTPAIVEAHYAAPLSTVPVQTEIGYAAKDKGLGTFIWLDEIELPAQRTEYYYAEDPAQLWVNVLTVADDDLNTLTLGLQPLSNVPGQSITRHWNQPMFSPALPDDSDESAFRVGNNVWLYPTLYADSEEHKAAFSCVFNCRTELATAFYRNGELFDDNPFDTRVYELTPERATYRVEVEYSQTLLELLQRQSVAWTFESEGAPGNGARLPLLVVRFAPALDERGRAPAGAFDLPLYIDPYGQASSTLTDAPSVEASFDDGVTWSRASVEADGLRWRAHLEHPDGAAYVSLRTSANDVYGNAVEQTLIRAYALGQEN